MATPVLHLAARARRYARAHCPAYGKGRPMRWAVARYALRVHARTGCPVAWGLWCSLALTPQVRTGY